MRAPHWLAFAAALGAIAVAFAQSPPPRKPPEPATAPTPAEQPVYRPPPRGTPPRRVGAATRSPTASIPDIAVIAPDHVGLTLREQPELYWFISAPSRVRIEVALVEEARSTTVKEVVLEGAAAAGIHRFSLSEQGVRLAPDVDYQWSVALVPDPEARSGDVVAAGAVRRVAPDAALAERLGDAPAERARALAAAGVWYDAFALLSAEVAARPGDREVREMRATLLEQVGLDEAAKFERR